VLAQSERDDATRAVVSAGATVTSWNVAGARTYATVSLGANVAPATLAALLRAEVVSPPLLILRVTPDASRALPGLERALSGPGRPIGVRDVRLLADAIVVECNANVTPLTLLVALIDIELASTSGRTIEPLIGLDDETLVAFARALLCEPELDSQRLIETHLADAIATAVR